MRILKHEDIGYWLDQIIPGELSMRQVDGWRVATTTWEEAELAATFDFSEIDTGLVLTEDNGREIRCELLTVGQVSEVEVTAVVTAAADMLKEAAGVLPAQPGVLLPDLGKRAGLDATVKHGLLMAPNLWQGQTPHLNDDERMTLILQVVMITDEEFGIGVDQGADKMQRRLQRRGENLGDWHRE